MLLGVVMPVKCAVHDPLYDTLLGKCLKSLEQRHHEAPQAGRGS